MKRNLRLILPALAVACALATAACGGDGGESTKPSKATADQLVTDGLKAHQAGNLAAARAAYQAALAKDPKNKFALFDLGVLDHATNPKAAENNYRLSLKTDPAFQSALYNLALLRMDAAPAEAATLLEKVVAADPKYAAGHYNLGQAYKRLGRPAEANAAFAKANELNPQIALERV